MLIKIKKLNGHSGCELNLYQNGDSFFIRKQSSNKNYNFRLKKQMLKQMHFISKSVYAPKILNSGIIDEKFYFDMEYIKGTTLANYSSSVLITEIADFIRILFKNLYFENTSNYNSNDVNKIFKNKINSLKEVIEKNKLTIDCFKLLDEYNWNNIAKSPCHGDLTLENIIITKDKKLYLIDFLDSFYNSWLIDIAKLLQDLEIGWSFRKETIETNKSLRLLVSKEALFEEIKKLNNGENLIKSAYYLLLLNVLRIYPYAKDESTFLYLNSSLIKILDIIQTKKEQSKCLL